MRANIGVPLSALAADVAAGRLPPGRSAADPAPLDRAWSAWPPAGQLIAAAVCALILAAAVLVMVVRP